MVLHNCDWKFGYVMCFHKIRSPTSHAWTRKQQKLTSAQTFCNKIQRQELCEINYYTL